MKLSLRHLLSALLLIFSSLILISCRTNKQSPPSDAPRLPLDVSLQDVSFHSASLDKSIQYRVILPKPLVANQKYPTIYLLHGGGGNFRDWSNYSEVARFAEHGCILIMPEGHSSYYTNAFDRPKDRYEDYITKDLITDVEAKFPVLPGGPNRAIIGVSMGGFGAIKIALVYPELYSFAGGLSPALDVPSRPISVKRIEQWPRFRAIFGPWQGQAQKDSDPFLLVKSADPGRTPYIFLTCGEQEGLLPANKKFANILSERKFQFEFHSSPGNHDWNQWNSWLPELSKSVENHFFHKR